MRKMFYAGASIPPNGAGGTMGEEKPVTETPPKEETPPETHEEITDEQIAEAEKEDPNKAVHLKAQKAKHEPPVGGKRWNEVYHEAKENERKLKESEARLAERDKDVELMRQHNIQIIEALKTAPKSEVKTEEGKTPQQFLTELRSAKKEALKNIDYEKAFQIQDQIDDLLIAVKSAPEKKEDTRTVVKQTVAEEEAVRAVHNFWKKNEWAARVLPDGTKNPKYDFVKAGAASELERSLLTDPAWQKRTYPELLEEVDKRITEHFAPKEPPPTTKLPAVGGIGGAGSQQAAKASLTSEQRRVIANMFPDDPDGEKKYVEQLTIIQKRGA
jgi:hypothetical protein